MRVPDLEADVEYEEDFAYLLSLLTTEFQDWNKTLDFWRAIPPENLHEVAVRARDFHGRELQYKEVTLR